MPSVTCLVTRRFDVPAQISTPSPISTQAPPSLEGAGATRPHGSMDEHAQLRRRGSSLVVYNSKNSRRPPDSNGTFQSVFFSDWYRHRRPSRPVPSLGCRSCPDLEQPLTCANLNFPWYHIPIMSALLLKASSTLFSRTYDTKHCCQFASGWNPHPGPSSPINRLLPDSKFRNTVSPAD